MILETLLSAAIETGLGLLAEAGLGDELRDLKARWLKLDERKRRQSFEAAFAKAKSAIADDAVQPLLDHRPFQEAVVTALLDPVGSPFDVRAAAADWVEKFPEHARPLTRFFKALESELLANAMWGPILERFYQLRESQRARAALAERNLDVPPLTIVREVLNVINSGPGGAAGPGGVAAGAGGVAIGGNVARIVIQQLILNSGLPPKSADARQRYLTNLLSRCRALPLAALGGDIEPHKTITLDKVYIALNTTIYVTQETLAKIQRGELTGWSEISDKRGGWLHESAEVDVQLREQREEASLLPAIETLRLTPRLALLGDPGAGKSTFARIVIACLIEGDPPPGLSADLLPVLIALRDLTPRLAALDLTTLPRDKHDDALAETMRDYVLASLAGLDAANFADGLLDALNAGKCLLVLDGLDEVPHDQRGLVRRAVAAVIARYSPQHLIVTCRVRSYVGDVALPGFDSYTLAPFDEAQVRAFAQAWYNAQKALGQMDATLAERRAGDLAEAALTESLRELSANPMMLTTIAIIHQKDVGLPKERVRLYSRAVDILLSRWQKEKVSEAALESFLKDERKLRSVMERLAHAAHSLRIDYDRREAVDLPRHTARDILERPECLGDANLALQFLDYVDQRTGLLVGKGGEPGRPTEYTFPHRTFQEYLAGCHLLTGSDSDRVTEFYARAGEGDTWNLAAQLGAEELFFNTRNGERQLLHLAYNLLAAQLTSTQSQRAALWAGQMAALAGRDSIERDTLPVGGPGYVARARAALAHALGGKLTPPERAEAGNALARLDDPRPEVMTVEAMQFCFVPSGSFMMGNNKGDEPDALTIADEGPRHEVTLPDYYIGLCPITNAQYIEFVGAGGYKELRYWAEARQVNVWSDGKVKAWNEDEPRERAEDYGNPFNLPNHPVVGVMWYEALAFTRWLTEHWKDRLPGRWAVRLPTEAEWEKAARGGLQIPRQPRIITVEQGIALAPVELAPNPNPTRRYVWGSEFIADNANISETNIEATSAAGCFPGGVSPYGAQDMIGNVWEWCQSKSVKYPYQLNDGREVIDSSDDIRVLRGGSFYFNRRLARCACRDHLRPDDRFAYGGFRVVVSPGSRS